MTDDEKLIEQLSSWDAVTAHRAADRIQELVKEREEVERRRVKWMNKSDNAEAKLTKAVEALREIYEVGNATGCNPQWMTNTAAKALAELEGK